jgi:hypothetical protein
MRKESRSLMTLLIITLTSACGGMDTPEQMSENTTQTLNVPTSHGEGTLGLGQNDKNPPALPSGTPSSDASDGSSAHVIPSSEVPMPLSIRSPTSEEDTADFTVTGYVWQLPWRGGGGGSWFDIRCGYGQIAVGIYGRSA